MASKKFSRLSVLLEAKDKMSSVFNKASMASKKLSGSVDKLGKEVKSTKKDFDYSNVSILRQKKNLDSTNQTIKKSVLASSKLGQAVRKTAMEFSVLKNNSKTIDKIKNSFNLLANPIKKVNDLLKLNVANFKQADASAKQFGNRRATFNQLADSNRRLNKELAKMNRELAKANSSLGSMRGHLGSLNLMGGAFTAMYTGQMAAQAGQSIATNTIGYSWEQEYAKQSVGILAGKENGEDFYNKIVDYSSSTVFAPEDWSRNLRGAIGKSKSTEDLEKYMLAMEQLATLDPVQGLDGAALAIRELNSGDALSLVERFELPRGALNDIKKIEDPIKQLDALMKVVGDETGFTIKNINDMKDLPLMQWEKAKNIWKTMNGYIGEKAAEKVAPIVKQFNKMWDEGKMEPFIEKAGDLLGKVTGGLINFVMNFATNYNKTMDAIKEKNADVIELFNNFKTTLSDLRPTFEKIGSNLIDIVNQMASVLNDAWPVIDKVFKFMVEGIEKLSSFVTKHFDVIISLVAGLAAAFASKKLVNAIKIVTGLFKTVRKFAKAGKLLTLFPKIGAVIAALSGPIGWIVAGVGALVAAGVYLYRNWDAVKTKAQEVWGVLKESPIAWFVAGPIMALISVLVWVYQNWDIVRSKISEVWSKITNSPIAWFIAGPLAGLISTLVWVKDNWETVRDKMQEVWDKVNESPLGGFITSVLTPMAKAISGIATAFDVAKSSFDTFSSAVSNFTMPASIAAGIPGLGGLAKTAINVGRRALGMGGADGSHHGGISNVPHDRYKAILHKGERVLTRQENKEYNSGLGGQIAVTGNTFVVREEADIDKVIDGLYRKIEERRKRR